MSIDYEEEGFKFARRRFEDGRKQGAVDFANEVKQYLMERINRPNARADIWSAEITKWYVEDLKILENRLKELKEKGV
jgi:hypothetical protein